MLIEFKDGGSALRFDQTEANTDSLLLIGTAVDGPVMEPVAVDIDTAEVLFGSDTNTNGTPNGATLVHAFKQAYDTGCRDIRLMRLSGTAAKATLQTPVKTVTTTERVDEVDIANVGGNDISTFTLAHTPIAGSTNIHVYAKSIELPAGAYSVSGNVVTLNANVCDAGSSINVKYKYITTASQTENIEAAANGAGDTAIVLSQPIATSVATPSLVVKKGSTTLIDGTDYTFTAATHEIVFNAASIVTVGDTVTAIYDIDDVVEVQENGNGTTPFIAATSDQIVMLASKPDAVPGVVLYVDDAKVLNTLAFKLDPSDATGKTLLLNKALFKRGQKVSVSYYVEHTQNVVSKIDLESYFGGILYNEGEVRVTNIYSNPADATSAVVGKLITIVKPASKRSTGEQPQTYSSLDFPTLGLLADAITANNGTYKATTLDDEVSTDSLQIVNDHFSGGDDGLDLTKDELFAKLSGTRDSAGYIIEQGAYQVLENYQVDSVVPVGVYADDLLADKYQNFAYELALFCAIASYKNKSTHGAIAMKPLRDTTLASIQKHAKYLAAYKNLYYLKDSTGADLVDANGDKMDLGKFISVCAGPGIMFSHKVNSLKEANPAVMYMGYNSTLQPQSAPTNKRILGSTGLKYNFSNAQLNDIVGNRFVTFGLKYSAKGQSLAGAYCIDGPTAAQPGSEYARLTTFKVIRTVADNMREVADPFIGEANTIEQRNSLSSAISKRLDILIEKGVILDYSFNLVAKVSDQLLGQASLELGIVAPQELRKITTVIGLKRS
jgi:hypothetical protein